MMKLKELKVGDTGKVTGYRCEECAYRQKLLHMGLTKQVEFKLVRKAPFGGPLEVEVRGSRVALRSDEADVLEVEKI